MTFQVERALEAAGAINTQNLMQTAEVPNSGKGLVETYKLESGLSSTLLFCVGAWLRFNSFVHLFHILSLS